MKISITGVTGFLGLHLVKALLDADHEVRALVRSPKKIPADIAAHPGFSFIQGDLQSDLSSLAGGADCVVHLAGLIKARNLSEFMAVNRDGAERVAQAAQAAKIARLVLLSSMAAREPKLSDYCSSKLAGEAAMREAYTGGKLVIIRAPAVFGPNDKATQPIFSLLKKGLLPVVGGEWKNVKLAMVYIDDLVRFITQTAINGDCDNETISPATIGSMSWQTFAQLSSAALGRDVKVLPVPVFIMKPAAAITSVTSSVFGVGHLTLGKLREFRHPDWTSLEEIDNPTPMIEALRITAASYEKG